MSEQLRSQPFGDYIMTAQNLIHAIDMHLPAIRGAAQLPAHAPDLMKLMETVFLFLSTLDVRMKSSRPYSELFFTAYHSDRVLHSVDERSLQSAKLALTHVLAESQRYFNEMRMTAEYEASKIRVLEKPKSSAAQTVGKL